MAMSINLLAQVAAPVAPASPATNTGFRLGLKLSPNVAWIRTDEKELESDGTRVGISWGLVCDLPVGGQGKYALHTGLLYNSIGGGFTSDFEAAGVRTTTEYDLKLNYLEIPVSLKLRGAVNDGPGFYGLIGMTGAVNLKARADGEASFTTGGTTTTTMLEDENVTDDIAALKLAFQVGAGLEFDLSGLIFMAGVTYNNGLTNILDGDAKKLIDEDDNKKLLADQLELTLAVFF